MKVTEEMQLAFIEAKQASTWGPNTAYVDGLAAVLAIVERDYDVRCGASGPSALTCEQKPGHTDKHIRVVPGDQVVFW